MATRRKKVPLAVKEKLIAESGGKCANPGCANWEVHLHHIKHWAVHQNHNHVDMIAICPSCHNEVHAGNLKITDQVLYQWKGIKRSATPDSGHIYVEPASQLKLLTGTIALSSSLDQAAIFELSNANRLTIRILDENILQVTSHLKNLKGVPILRVVENHVRVHHDPNVEFSYRAGHARATTPTSEDYIPNWLIENMKSVAPEFAAFGRVTAFEIEVVKPGVVRVEGFWPDSDTAVVITKELFCFCRREGFRGGPKPLCIKGGGEDSLLKWFGKIDKAMFNFA